MKVLWDTLQSSTSLPFLFLQFRAPPFFFSYDRWPILSVKNRIIMISKLTIKWIMRLRRYFLASHIIQIWLLIAPQFISFPFNHDNTRFSFSRLPMPKCHTIWLRYVFGYVPMSCLFICVHIKKIGLHDSVPIFIVFILSFSYCRLVVFQF